MNILPAPDQESADRTADHARTQPPETSTRILLARAREGDAPALEEICARYLYRLSRWATGRLPNHARGLVDTGDLVQETLVGSIHRLDDIRAQQPESFPAYLRTTLLNRIRQELRRLASQPDFAPLGDSQRDLSPTPLEETIGRDLTTHYEDALARLNEKDRSILFLRMEMDMTYKDIAVALDRPSAEAARKAASRALVRLAQEIEL